MKKKWFGSAKKGCFVNRSDDFLSYDDIFEMMHRPADELCLAFSTPLKTFGYYVSRQFKYISEGLVFHRNFVLSFKDGHMDSVDRAASMVAHYIVAAGLQDATLVCCPTSSPASYLMRFGVFMEEVARIAGIEDGYDLVEVTSIRKEVHMGGSRNQKNYQISPSVKGRKIVLFDDVLTTGQTWLTFATELEALGAEVVQGIFLAEAIMP